MTVRPGVIPLTRPAPQQLRRFGKYYLVRKLAEGGMAEIYLAKQLGTEGFERDVVVKCMLSHFGRSREFVEMFLDEARLAARLFHPNIVQITELGVEDGRHYICMEYLPGEDLEAIIEHCGRRKEPIPLAVATKIILSACEGLEFAHAYTEGGQPVNLVHRDVSPSNIIVTYQGTVKLVDFGIAKASSKFVQTQPGTLKGKWGYMSPEQARGEHLDCRSDLFSLGVTFYELLTGRRVFQRDNEIGVLLALMQQPIPSPRLSRPDIPESIEQIVMKALARHPAERYQTAGEMRADLETFLAGTSSIPGVTQLSHYMHGLFGREHAEKRTRVPTLKELEARGYVAAPAPAAEGLEPTFIRPAPAAGSPSAHRQSRAHAAAPPTLVLSGRSRWGSALLGSLAAVLLLAGGGAAVFFLEPLRAAWAPATSPAPPPLTPVRAEERPPEPIAAEPAPPALAPATPPGEPLKERTKGRAALLTPKDVNRVLLRSRERLMSCGELHKDELPPDGLVRVQVTILRSGRVSSAGVTTAGLEGTQLTGCLVKEISSARFPRNSNDPELQIELPMQFRQL